MRSIHALCPTTSGEAVLRRYLAGSYDLHCHDTTAALLASIAVSSQHVIVVELHALHAESTLDAIRTLYSAAPLIPIVGSGCVDSAEDGRLVEDATVAGMSALLIRSGKNLRGPQRVFDTASAVMIAKRLRPETSQIPDAVVASFCHCCLASALFNITVQSIATRLHVESYNVSRSFRLLNMSTPRSFVAEIRALLAVYLLTDRTRSVREVARTMKFADEKALRRLLAIRADPGFVKGRTVTTFLRMLDGVCATFQRAQGV